MLETRACAGLTSGARHQSHAGNGAEEKLAQNQDLCKEGVFLYIKRDPNVAALIVALICLGKKSRIFFMRNHFHNLITATWGLSGSY